MGKASNYVIVEDDFTQEKPLVIKDVGPWDRYLTVTNGAEQVVADLVAMGKLPLGRKLLYYDSDGVLDEILIVNGKFAGFKPGPDRTAVQAIKKAWQKAGLLVDPGDHDERDPMMDLGSDFGTGNE